MSAVCRPASSQKSHPDRRERLGCSVHDRAPISNANAAITKAPGAVSNQAQKSCTPEVLHCTNASCPALHDEHRRR